MDKIPMIVLAAALLLPLKAQLLHAWQRREARKAAAAIDRSREKPPPA